jgi:RNA polymerase sigma-70 factor (ECF subfamily)
MMGEESAELLARWKSGDQAAARLLFERYASRLVALAQVHLPGRLTRRLDSEDVVQSVFRSFFARAQEGGFILGQSGDLWRLLAAMTLHKLYRRVEQHSAQKRSVAREQEAGAGVDLSYLPPEALSGEPSPEEAVALADELEAIMRDLDPLRRRMLEMRLQNYTLDEIAADTRRSERTVRRFLDQIKHGLEQSYLGRSA